MMATLFTRIINGELPGRFVWKDDQCVAFLTINPIRPGHTLVVPRAEIDHWLDMDPNLAAHVIQSAQSVGKAIARAFNPTKVGIMLAGLEVPHVHFHLLPIDHVGDLDFSKQDMNAKPEALDKAAEQIRRALRELGYSQVST
jgi:histidine triad (HIT) family protein